MTRCIFAGNSAFDGAGMYNLFDSDVTVSGCVFSGNAADDGGAMASYFSEVPVVIQCTFAGNTANAAGGLHFSSGGGTVRNCIVRDNGLDPIVDDALRAPITIQFSNVEGGWAGAGNLDLDAIFADPGGGDFRLAPGSPCIDAGLNAAVPAGVVTDLDGNPRFADDPSTPDCAQEPGACGDPPVVDLGAYEFQCPWDLDHDGSVATTDFLALLGAWGPNPGHPADFNADGFVGTADFLALLGNWGSCP